MPSYVDGFVIPIAKDKIADYQQMAELGRQVWKEHGALQYIEAAGDDLDAKFGISFPKTIKLKPGATARERAYIDALAERYSGKTADRRPRDAAYAAAMKKLHERFPADLDAAAKLVPHPLALVASNLDLAA